MSESKTHQKLTKINGRLARYRRLSPIRLPLNLLSFDFAGVVVLFVIMAVSLANGDLGRALSIGMLVAINQSIAAVCALAPKQLWNFADYRSARERPTLSYLISGACTLTITLPISFGFYLLREHFPHVHPILPFAAAERLRDLMTAAELRVQFVRFREGHAIPPNVLAALGQFLTALLQTPRL